MEPSIRALFGHVLAIALLFVLSFCSKTGSDPTPTPQPALISPSDAKSVGAALIMPTGTETKTGTLPTSSTSTQAPKATASTTQISSTTGSTASLGVNYSNLNGAAGGVYAHVQGAPTYFSIPLSGTAATSGKITIPIGIPANLDNGSFTIVISIYDASGRVSNTVSITITIGTTAPPVSTNDDPYKDGDPYAKDYFIEYYENGDFHSLNYTTSPVSFTYQGNYPLLNSTIGCKISNQSSASTYIPCAGSGECDKFSLSFVRDGWDKIPKVGEYAFSLPAGGNVELKIDGANNCLFADKPDTYIKLSITEVKVVKDYGPAKSDAVVKVGQDIRGYFSGEFEAILYGQSFTEASLGIYRKSIITKGRFKLPMGGSNANLNGTGTVIKADRMALLTAGKWYFDPAQFPACLADDYFQFRKDGTFDYKRGNVKCEAGVSDNNEIINNSWYFKNNQTVLHIKYNCNQCDEGEANIIELSETTLKLRDSDDARVLSFKRSP